MPKRVAAMWYFNDSAWIADEQRTKIFASVRCSAYRTYGVVPWRAFCYSHVISLNLRHGSRRVAFVAAVIFGSFCRALNRRSDARHSVQRLISQRKFWEGVDLVQMNARYIGNNDTYNMT